MRRSVCAAARAVDGVERVRAHEEADGREQHRRDEPDGAVIRGSAAARASADAPARCARAWRSGDPKKRVGMAMPAKTTPPNTKTSFTMLAHAVPRSPALKTKSAEHEKGDADRDGRVVGAVAGDAQQDLQAAKLQRDIGHDHHEPQQGGDRRPARGCCSASRRSRARVSRLASLPTRQMAGVRK